MYEGEEEDRYERAFVDERQGINRAARNEELRLMACIQGPEYGIEKELLWMDKNLLEDDIIDLTDLLEEGQPAKEAASMPTHEEEGCDRTRFL
ncbi:MAG: hypothetical protein MZU95_11675 [Desulfomicrobium escambiense]|nr:hypothetical protein [Desulfomicrobium escambiense]